MAELPSGTVTFLFTDLEGSSTLWEQHPDAMRGALARHDALIGDAIVGRAGHVVKTTGDGFLAAFASALDAVAAAVDAQLALGREPWVETGPLRVRMGIHTGAAELRDGDYFGPTLNRAARLMSIGHGGQILLSLVTSELVRGDGVELTDLGSHALRGLTEPERVFQVLHPALQVEFASLRSVSTARRPARSNLPAPVDRFVGRTRELREVGERFARTRLLTLLGPGGTGKTRLAIELAIQLREEFDDLVYFIDLSTCRDLDAALAVIARTVEVRDQGDRALLDAIKDLIGAQPMLLVFDNFEQVTSAAPAVAELLRDCSGLKALVTTREALNVTGEHVHPVAPLTLPDAQRANLALDELAASEAVQLFVDRARAVRPDFELSADNADAVLELCRRLDGLPLAIELATARLALFTPQALVERLGRRLDLLKGGARDAPERQRALRDTIAWSYELLDEEERRSLAVLAVFSGATLEAVEAVADHFGVDVLDAMDAVGSLVNKSLVRQVDVRGSGTRITMLETIRDFALERLAAEPEIDRRARRAHAEYFADWTLRHCAKLTGDDRDAVAERMAADIENLTAAWRYWVNERDFEQLGKLVDGLWLLNNVRGWFHDTANLITDLLDVLSSTPSNDERLVQQILLQTSLARVLMASEGFTPTTQRAFERTLELCDAQGEVPQLLPVLRGLSTFYIYRAEFETANRIGEQLLALGERFDDDRARVEGHLVIGASDGMLARLRPGLEHLEHAIATYDETPRRVERFDAGNDPGVVSHLVEGMLLWMTGYPDRALELANEAISIATRLHHPQSLAYAHFHTGLIHVWLREPEHAAEHAVAVIDLGEEYDLQVWAAVGRCLHGVALAATGNVDEGIAIFDVAMERYQELQSPPVFWPSLLHFRAMMLGLLGQPNEGLVAIDEAIEMIVGLPEPQTFLSELLLVRGELILAATGDAVDAARCYERALRSADRLDAPMLQLRAAVPLARLWADAGRRGEARALVTEAYDRFSEGFATVDLREARGLLEGLAATR
ncbi:MAG: adenylate/guanylate cyclase domain-containing protein [Acidimicrobiia bacterium]